jgi:hypothetical protein
MFAFVGLQSDFKKAVLGSVNPYLNFLGTLRRGPQKLGFVFSAGSKSNSVDRLILIVDRFLPIFTVIGRLGKYSS